MLRAILADDLTGGADTAAAIGGRTRLTAWPSVPWAPGLDPDFIQVHDTETRGLGRSAAAARVAAACRAGGISSGLYKKVDSTLRGNPGAEIEAILEVCSYRLAVVAPALPEQGRTVVDGILRVHGTPVSQSVLGRDPRSPVARDQVVEILRATTDLPVALVRVANLQSCTARIAVLDARDAVDLAEIAAALLPDMLPVGSAGLARAISSLGGEARREGAPPPRCHSVRVLVGSANPVALAQAALVTPSARVRVQVGSVLEQITRGLGEDHGERPLAVVATGGETALAACAALGASALLPQAELAPGVVWSLVEDTDGVIMVTKAGGFGPPEALRDIVETLLKGHS